MRQRNENKHSNQAQLTGEFMRQMWRIYGLSDIRALGCESQCMASDPIRETYDRKTFTTQTGHDDLANGGGIINDHDQFLHKKSLSCS
jgi:hypothetical protein